MKQTTHFIGIGGTGLSAIARVLMQRGEQVSGSDRENSPLAAGLAEAGAKIMIGHAEENLTDATRVIRSSAIPEDNIELLAAYAKGLPVFKRSEILGDLLVDHQVIAVAGSHGKTTTTAMLAWILTSLNQKPGYIIGSVSRDLESNASAGDGQLFVIEADEYDHMFLGLNPSLALVTNVDYDHPDFFPSEGDFFSAFYQFADRIQQNGQLLICADNARALILEEFALEQGISTLSYALKNNAADYWAKDLMQVPGKGFSFTFTYEGNDLASVEMLLPGQHNAENALGALAAVHILGLPLEEAALALGKFQGTGRRFDIRGEVADILLIDDYAHHPAEIRAVLSATRSLYPDRRIVALWQPHTYSRTTTLLKDYATAFAEADRLLVTDVYAAREEQPQDFYIEQIVADIQSADAIYSAGLAHSESLLLSELKAGDVLIVLSAGDAIEITANLHQKLEEAL